MVEVSLSSLSRRGEGVGVGFVGNYLPRKCGIATFTYDLAEAVARRLDSDQDAFVVAMNDRAGGYNYPRRVKFEVRDNHAVDYLRAAHYLNESGAQVVCLQHEYGIFGEGYGANVLTLLRSLELPLVVTCHTVLEQPAPGQFKILKEIIERAAAVVVMSRRAAAFLDDVYRAGPEKVLLIPHGVHPFPYVEPDSYKGRLGLHGRRVLLTFGLVNPNKGIEYMIEAMPAIVDSHPDAKYLIVGRTHPAVVQLEGEAYRHGLQARVRELGLEAHVTFLDRFVELDELLSYIAASDVCVTPYLTLDHISSGVLAYALAMGRPAVSTPYWCAKELLANGRGRLVPRGDSAALASEILGLLGDDEKMALMRRKAYAYCQHMTWPAVAESYVELFKRVSDPRPALIRMSEKDELGRQLPGPTSAPV